MAERSFFERWESVIKSIKKDLPHDIDDNTELDPVLEALRAELASARAEIAGLGRENALLRAAPAKSARARRRIRRMSKFDPDKAAAELAKALQVSKAELAALKARLAEAEAELARLRPPEPYAGERAMYFSAHAQKDKPA